MKHGVPLLTGRQLAASFCPCCQRRVKLLWISISTNTSTRQSAAACPPAFASSSVLQRTSTIRSYSPQSCHCLDDSKCGFSAGGASSSSSAAFVENEFVSSFGNNNGCVCSAVVSTDFPEQLNLALPAPRRCCCCERWYSRRLRRL